MPRKIKGLYLRKDGIYEKTVTEDGTRYHFRSSDPDEVWRKYYNWREGIDLGPFFSEVAEQWEEEHLPTLSHNTKKGYMPAYKRIYNHFGSQRIKQIEKRDIDVYIKQFSSTRAFKTVTNELLVIRLIMDFACYNGLLIHSPARYCKVPKGLARNPRAFPTDAEIQIVKQSIDKPFGLLYYLILYSGCRLGEALALQWKDIDFENQEIKIYKSVYYVNNRPMVKQPKSDAGKRATLLLAKLSEVLEPMKGEPEELIFHEDGKLLSGSMVQRRKRKYEKSVGINITPHQLRHGFATMLFEAGVEAKTAQYLLGHAQISTTMDVYTRLRKQQLISAAKKLNEIDIDTE